jgi:hypothetical protein
MLEINLTGAFRLYCKAYKMEGLTEIRHPSNRLQHKEPGVTAVTVETVEYRHHRILQEKKKTGCKKHAAVPQQQDFVDFELDYAERVVITTRKMFTDCSRFTTQLLSSVGTAWSSAPPKGAASRTGKDSSTVASACSFSCCVFIAPARSLLLLLHKPRSHAHRQTLVRGTSHS